MVFSPQTNATSSIVDDRDSRFTYSGVWRLGGSVAELDSTTHGSNVTGSTAVLTFNGTSLILYGTISPTDENEPPVSSYSIDNKTASIYPAPATNSTLYQQILFETYGLTAGEHSLTVTIKSTQPGDYWLDYAVICTEAMSNNNSAKSDSKTGTIVDGVLGGILFLLVDALFLTWYGRRRQNRGMEIAAVTHGFVLQSDASHAEMSSASLPRSKTSQAVNIPQLERRPSPPGSGSFSSLPTTYGGPMLTANHALIPTSVSQNPHHSTTHIISNPSTPADSSGDRPFNDQGRPPRRKGVSRPTPPSPTRVAPRLHEDGGIRLEGGRLNDPETMVDVPPVYREY